MVLTGMSVVGVIADIMGSKADMKSPMSVFLLISSALPPKADISGRSANVR